MRKEYPYENGNTIVVCGHDATIGGMHGAVMKGGKCRFEGTLFQCVVFLAQNGDKLARRHAAAMRQVINRMQMGSATRTLRERSILN